MRPILFESTPAPSSPFVELLINARRQRKTEKLRQALRQRGYCVNYRPGMDCPGCGGRAFFIGRQSAECARCGTAVPFAQADGGQR